MADEDDDIENEDGEENADNGDGKKDDGGQGKKKLLIIAVVAILLVVGGIAGAYFTGLLDPVIEMIVGPSEEDADAEGEGSDTGVYYEIPELLVNLNTADRKSAFLKIRISIEIESSSGIPKIERIMPRIIDNFQVYLRELRLEDLKGAAGMYRLREELLTRVSAAAAPVKIKDVLFREMLVQ